MSFTNINDPAGVKALLDRLRTSQAWQNLVNTQTPAPAPEQQPPTSETSSVAALLSQLNSAPTPTPTLTHPRNAENAGPPLNAIIAPPTWTPSVSPSVSPTKSSLKQGSPPSPLPPVSAPYTATEDVRSLTFQQALPRLAQLSDDPALVAAIETLRRTQDKVERELWAERNAIRAKYEEKVRVAKTKATLIGTGLSKHEAEMLTQAYERELRRFDAERVLPAWDGLVTSQQAALAQLKVPAMFPTAVKADRERQQRVIQVLEGIVGGGA